MKPPRPLVDYSAESQSDSDGADEEIVDEVAPVADTAKLHGLVLSWQEKLWEWQNNGVELTEAEEKSLGDFKAVLRDVEVCKTLLGQLQGDEMVFSKTFFFPNPRDSADRQAEFVCVEQKELEVFKARMLVVARTNAISQEAVKGKPDENALRWARKARAADEADLQRAEASLKMVRASVQISNGLPNAQPNENRIKMKYHKRLKRILSATASPRNRIKEISFVSPTFTAFRSRLYTDVRISPPWNMEECRWLWNSSKLQIQPMKPKTTKSSHSSDVDSTTETVPIGRSADVSGSGIVTPQPPSVSANLPGIVAVNRQQSASPKTKSRVQLDEYPPAIVHLNNTPADLLQQPVGEEHPKDDTDEPQLRRNVQSVSVVDVENDIEPAVAYLMEDLLSEVTKNENEKVEGIIIRTEEKLSIEMSRDGHLNSLHVNGLTTLKVTDDKSSRIRIKMQNSDRRGAQLQTHPNLDKELFRNDSVLALKNPQKPFPINCDVGVLKWRVRSQVDDSSVPMSINCWPTESGNGCDVNIEYTLEMPDLELQDVVISIPLPSGAAPVMKDCDGEYKYERVHNWLDWKLPVVNRSNKTGSLEFSTSTGHPDNFFPIRVQFHSQIQYCDIVPTEVIRSDDNSPAKYSFESILLTEKFEVV